MRISLITVLFLYTCLAASSFANISEIESTNLDLCQVEDEKLSETLDELVGMNSLRTDMQGLSSNLRENNSKNVEVILNPDHDLWFDAYDALLSQGEIWWNNHAVNGASLLSIDDLGIMTKKNDFNWW